MFKNVVSTQDLLSDSQRSTYSSDSALFSLSQRQQSQNDFSQVRTQDLFTQNHTTGSQSESSFPQSRKMSMYDKWMSKGAMFRKDQTKPSTSCQLPFQQQNQQNFINKAKDIDDRDLMQQVVNIVQDCNKEVRNALTAVKEKLDSQSECSGEKLSDTMKAFLEDLWKHEDRMLQAIEEGKQTKEKLHELEKQLVAKDVELKQIQGQLEGKEKPGDLKQVAKAVRQEMLSPHLAVENKLMEILEVTREASEHHSQQLTQYQNQITAQAKEHKEWKTANQKFLNEMEKRLQKDLSALRKELQNEEEEWRSNVQDQLLEACTSHTQDMERLIERAIAECTAVTTKQGISNATATSAIVAAVKKYLQATLQKQTKSTEKSLHHMCQQQVHKQQEQLHHIYQTILTDITAGVHSLTEQCRERNKNDWEAPLTVPVFEEKIEEHHADIRNQLEEMHRHHVEEVRRLQKDSQLSDAVLSTGTARRLNTGAMIMPAQGVNSVPSRTTRTTGYQLQRRNLGRISPLSEEDKCNLFSKRKSSPVVTVLPQQHSVVSHSTLTERNTQMDSETEVIFQRHPPQSAKPEVKVKPCKNRKRNGGRKKHAAKKQKTPEKAGAIQDQKSVFQRGKPRAGNQLTVYDFSDEQSPDQGSVYFNSFKLQKHQDQQNLLCSPTASTKSCLSSPAVSVTVDTEVVWVRCSRWQTSSAPRQIPHADINATDMLSSPFMAGAVTQRSHQQLEAEADSIRSRTRSGTKRLH